MKKIFFRIAALLSLTVITYSACQKDDYKKESTAASTTSVEENALADETFTDIFADLAGLAHDDEGPFSSIKKRKSEKIFTDVNDSLDDHQHNFGCADVTVAPEGTKWPKTVTVDFGTGCTHHGITKKGKIIAVFSNDFRIDSSKINISFDGFYVNDHKIEGTSTITNKGENISGNHEFTIEIKNGKIIGNKTLSWSSMKTIEWAKGIDKTSPLDDKLRITGTASGINTAGKNFTVNITKHLVRPVVCPFFTEGTLEVKQADNTLILDYGEGTCDNEATVTVNGQSIDIELKK